MTSQFLITLLLLSAYTLTSATEFGRPLNRELKELKKKEHLTHFKFYWHEAVGGNNDTAAQIIPSIPKYESTSSFGGLRVIDTPLTLGPKLSSKHVGRAEGLYAATSLTQLELLMIQTFNFFEGKYNGSTINVLGRNVVLNKTRELSVVGGSGVFRFAKGYAELSTYSFDPKSGSSIVQYNLYVLHY
ncbi:putative allene oxide cyclase/dirigent protein [Lupinus albus]|uniref:Dirigent protein n=1 Tax=Lupinus albus TaxID=3870 RepID=A0A6A4QB86_LUPAL|nr:putative allene oxide cyclase/dirigent protein [Lupinus albus]